jgi:hypothetical protein
MVIALALNQTSILSFYKSLPHKFAQAERVRLPLKKAKRKNEIRRRGGETRFHRTALIVVQKSIILKLLPEFRK